MRPNSFQMKAQRPIYPSMEKKLEIITKTFDKSTQMSDIYLMKIVEVYQQMKRDPGQQWKLDYYSY